MKNIFLMLGRVCLSLFFIMLVTNQILNWDAAHQSFIKAAGDWVNHPGLPLQVQQVFQLLFSHSSLVVLIMAIFAGVGALFILLGINIRLGAVLLILFFIVTTLVMHPFWFYDGLVREGEMAAFIKNVSILGGLFILAATSGGGGE